MPKSQAAVNMAILMLRPGIKRYEITNKVFSIWEDPRPQPTWEEVEDTVNKIKSFENSVNTIYLED